MYQTFGAHLPIYRCHAELNVVTSFPVLIARLKADINLIGTVT